MGIFLPPPSSSISSHLDLLLQLLLFTTPFPQSLPPPSCLSTSSLLLQLHLIHFHLDLFHLLLHLLLFITSASSISSSFPLPPLSLPPSPPSHPPPSPPTCPPSPLILHPCLYHLLLHLPPPTRREERRDGGPLNFPFISSNT